MTAGPPAAAGTARAAGADAGARGRTLFLVVAVLALAIRLVHLVPFSQQTPFFDPAPWSRPDRPLDPGEYDRWGMQISGGDPWWTDNGPGERFESPVYPYFVAGIYRALGGRNLLGLAIAQAVLMALTCALTALLALRLLSPAAGWIAGLLAAFCAPLIFEASFPQKEVLSTFLVTLGLMATCRAHRRLPAGLAWGAVIATAPILTPVALCALAWCLMRAAAPREGEEGTPASLTDRASRLAPAALAALCGLFLAILPCTLRNVIGENRFVLIADAGPPSWETRAGAGGESAAAAGRPGPVLGRLAGFFGPQDRPQTTDFSLLREASPVLALPLPGMALLGPLALAGLGLTARRWRQMLPVHAVAVIYPLTLALFMLAGRQRLPALPAIILLAAAALEEMRGGAAAALRGRSAPPRRALLAAAGAVTAWIILGALAARAGAGAGGDEVVPFHQAYAEHHLELAEIAVRNNRPDQALGAYDQVLRLPSRRIRGLAHAGRARVHLLPGVSRPDEALKELRLSLAADPDQPDAGAVRELIARIEAGGRAVAR